MKSAIHVLIFFNIIFLFGCSKKIEADNDYNNIDIIIDNQTEESIFIEKVELVSTSCTDNEKIYELSTSILSYYKDLSMHGPFAFNIEILPRAKHKTIIKGYNFPNNDKISYYDNDEKAGIETIKNFYPASAVKFELYYTKVKIESDTYKQYISMAKQNGFGPIQGYIKNSTIYFLIK
ncbi:hypothetical protein AGMMS49579_25440 [Spirochaetia bacterium]|nr:hypothetical protein AGMMS49579_25440 [Spirochaetia bacterium]